jgi:hypothetical protein
MHFPNRLALEGEELVLHRFSSGSKGLVSPVELQAKEDAETSKRRSFWLAVKDFFSPPEPCRPTAVCVPPCARLQLHDIGPDIQIQYDVSTEEEVRFEQLSVSVNTYRDAVCFLNGRRVGLQQLPEGQRVTVLSLADAEVPEPAASEEPLRWAA